MTDTQYTFDTERNDYFNGTDLRVTETGTDKTISLNVKDDLLAVEVKDHQTRNFWPEDVQAAADAISEQKLEALYESAQTAYWEASQAAASEAGLGQVYGAGRSGGWMAVDGSKPYSLQDIIDPDEGEEGDADFAARFLRFAFERVDDIEYHRGLFFDAVKEAAAEPEPEPDPVGAEPIKVLAILWVDDDGIPNCNLYRNKPSLLGAMGTYYEGAATTALNEPGELIATDGGEVVAFLTVVE
jgi:hypothetical protein